MGTLLGASSQMASGFCERTSFISGTVTSATKVRSNSPATKARMRAYAPLAALFDNKALQDLLPANQPTSK